MAVIFTRYLPATDTRGARIAARCCGFRTVTPYRNDASVVDNHVAAARKLSRKIDSFAALQMGETDDGFVFVSVHPSDRFEV